MVRSNFLRKMGVYNLNINGMMVQAKVLDNEELVNDGITQLRNKLDPIFPIVGFDWKCTTESVGGEQKLCPKLLVLYVKDRCLLVQLEPMYTFRDSLTSFLSDEGICFLSLQDPKKFRCLKMPWGSSLDDFGLQTCVDIGTFAAKALKNRELKGCTNLVELASKAGFPVQEQASQTTGSQCPVPDWGAICFTQEEVTYALKDAFECYNLGVKLTSAL